jgi:hypothetical protein
MIAVAFLTLLCIGSIHEILTDIFFGCVDSSDDRQWDPTADARQIEKAARLFRSGKFHQALRLCNGIIASNSQYASTVATLIYWIENPGALRMITLPHTMIKFKGRYSGLNDL